MHSPQLEIDKCELLASKVIAVPAFWDLPWPCCRKFPVWLPCWQLCPARLQERKPGVRGRKRRSASRGDGGAPGWWRSGWRRPPPHSGLRTGSRCLERHRKQHATCTWQLPVAFLKTGLLKWKSWHSPGTEAGTVRLRAVTVAMPTSWGVYFLVQECPAVTMLGFSRVPSRYTWWSDRALYTAARTYRRMGRFITTHALKYDLKGQYFTAGDWLIEPHMVNQPFLWHTGSAAGHGLRQGGSLAPQWAPGRSGGAHKGLKISANIFDHNEFISVENIAAHTHTCWQMLAYLARTLAFSAMARADGQPSEILSTHLHLAKSQPSFLYWAQRSERPSRPVEKTTSRRVLVRRGGNTQSAETCKEMYRFSNKESLDFWVLIESKSIFTLCGGLAIRSI